MLHPKLTEGLLTALDNYEAGATVPLAQLFGEYGDEEAKKAYEELITTHPAFPQMLKDKYLSPDPDMDYLATLSEDTFGKTYYHYITDQGLDPNLLRKAAPVQKYYKTGRDADYGVARLYQLHDIWHVLTGYDTSREGEIKVVSFTVAQNPSPYPALIIATRPLQAALYHPERLIPLMDLITEGWQRGRRAKTLMNVHWEEMWERPLADIRREYNLDYD